MNRKLISLTAALVLTVSSLPVLASQQQSAPTADRLTAAAAGTPTPEPGLIRVRKQGGEQQDYAVPTDSPSIIAVL